MDPVSAIAGAIGSGLSSGLNLIALNEQIKNPDRQIINPQFDKIPGAVPQRRINWLLIAGLVIVAGAGLYFWLKKSKK